MRSFKTVYPYLEHKVNEILVNVVNQINFGKHNDSTIKLLFILKKHLECLLNTLSEEPSFNSNELGKEINSTYQRDKDVDGIQVNIYFKESPDLSRMSKLTYNCFKE